MTAAIGLLLLALMLPTAASFAQPQAASLPAAPAARPVILVLGDSLSAEYGLPRGTGWVQLIANRLRSSDANYTVVNASISGETTSGGRARLPALLKQHRPAIVVIELGGNDGLRGLPVKSMQDNLSAMVQTSQEIGARVLLVGIRVPPNYGRDYGDRFFATFATVARARGIAYAPFLLEGFGEGTELFQADRIHPTERAQAKIADTVWPYLQPLLRPAPKAPKT